MAPIIDVHTHWLSARRFPDLALSGAVIPDVLPDGTARMVIDGVSSLIYPDMFDDAKQEQVARQAGVDLRILTPSMQLNLFSKLLDLPVPEIARRINDDGAALMRRFPGRTAVMATVSPFDQETLPELQRCHRELGMTGAFIDTSWYPDGGWKNVYPDDPRTEPFWAYVAGHGIPVFLHPSVLPYGHEHMNSGKLEETVGRPADTTLAVARLILSGLLDRYPSLKIVLAHMGAALLPVIGRLEFGHRLGYAGLPDGQAAACKLAPSAYLRRNFYVDTMGFWPPHLREAVEVFGADRVLLGSDYPAVPISPREHGRVSLLPTQPGQDTAQPDRGDEDHVTEVDRGYSVTGREPFRWRMADDSREHGQAAGGGRRVYGRIRPSRAARRRRDRPRLRSCPSAPSSGVVPSRSMRTATPWLPALSAVRSASARHPGAIAAAVAGFTQGHQGNGPGAGKPRQGEHARTELRLFRRRTRLLGQAGAVVPDPDVLREEVPGALAAIRFAYAAGKIEPAEQDRRLCHPVLVQPRDEPDPLPARLSAQPTHRSHKPLTSPVTVRVRVPPGGQAVTEVLRAWGRTSLSPAVRAAEH
jgi:aminocarboxymuconate-semialdehyde decarboxylase